MTFLPGHLLEMSTAALYNKSSRFFISGENPKGEHKMSNRKRVMTWTQYQFWLAAAKEKHGHNMLDWPRNIRKYHNSIKIVDDRPRPSQLSIPYGNTGVSNKGVR